MGCDIPKDNKTLDDQREIEKQAMQDAFWKAVEEHGATNVLQSMFDHYCR